jgi:signal transduction histidine kinase/ligand-binding sensor domain-containing protein
VLHKTSILNLLLLLSLFTSAQVDFVRMDQITSSDGLCSDIVWKSIRDRQGFMWFATDDGLARYDGKDFITLRSEAGNKESFETNMNFDVINDHEGIIWSLTKNSLIRVDPRTLSAERHNHKPDNFKTEINTTQRLHAIAEDASNNLWLVTTYGIFILNADRKAEKYIMISDDSLQTEYNHCNGICFDGSNNAWITTRAGIVRISAQDHSIKKFPFEFISDYGQAIVYWKNKIWACSEQFWTFDTTSLTYEKIESVGFSGLWPVHLLADPSNSERLWIAFRNHGLGSFSLQDSTVIYFSSDEERNKIKPQSTFSLFADSNCLWLNTGGGVYQFYPKHQFVKRLDIESNFGKGEESVFNLFTTPLSDEILLKTSNYLHRWDREYMQWMRHPGFHLSTGQELQGINFYSRDRHGAEWLSVGYQGVYRCLDGKCDLVLADSTVEKGPRDYRWYMSDVLHDTNDRSWIVAESKLVLYEGGKLTFYTPPSILNQKGDTLMEKASFGGGVLDSQGNIWIFSEFAYENHVIAIYKFDVSSHTFSTYCFEDGRSEFPEVSNIFSMIYARDRIWCGAEGGLIRFDPKSSEIKFEFITAKDWLPSSLCGDIVCDQSGKIWMSCRNGLVCWVDDEHVTVLKKSDGLIRNSPGRLCLSNDNVLYLYTYTDIQYFNPNEISVGAPIRNIILTELNVNSRPYQGEVSASYLEDISLSWNENNISLTFSSLLFEKSAMIEYAYKLEGAEEDWNYTRNVNSVTYSDLRGGDYIFKVKAKRQNGDWTSEMLSLPIHIQTAWFRSWWFYSLIGIIVLLALYLFYKSRLQRAIEVERVKSHIATDLHDDVGSALSSLILYSDMLSEQEINAEKRKLISAKISQTAQKSMEGMRDIIWSLQIGEEPFEESLVHFKRTANDILDSSGKSFHLRTSGDFSKLKLDLEKRKNLFLIFKEAVNNARKYSTGNEINVDIRLRERELFMFIHDNGSGFNIAETSNGNGLRNMKKRAELSDATFIIESDLALGTRISVAFRISSHEIS